ncbi:MAG: DUF4973 domain-containing protein [Bacteroidales bacterium]|nr:DUF4973 domain-containing protein [Bacteroidales bacterium]
MKKIYLYMTAILGCASLFFSCNDEWKDELYTQMVSLKAPINMNDVSVIYLKYQPNGEVTYKLPVIISGSKNNANNYKINIGIDNDTINDLNFEKYSYREDLYYKQLPESFYTFPSSTCNIPSGSDVALFDINFNFTDLDLVEKWVLPVTVLPDNSYTLNTYKGRQKALLWVMPFNDYSGTYSATSMYVYFKDNTTSYMTASTRECKVVDENSIFFYAGITEELAENRGAYKVKCEFLPPTEDEEILDESTGEGTGLYKKKGNLNLTCDNDSVNFVVTGQPTYEIREEFDIDRPFLVKRFYTLTMEYSYEDYTSSKGMNFPYRCKGTMLMQRNINTLIPDEDQAILW